MAKVVISAGHGKHVSGAVGFINEYNEAVKVGKRVKEILGKDAIFYQDVTSRNQRDNLNNIVKFHNSKARDLDVSIHFNAASAAATGSECLYYDAKNLSAKMSKAMAGAIGIKDRGPKIRKELYFLANTKKPAILLEVCFVSNKGDSAKYKKNFEKLCQAIAKVIAAEVKITIGKAPSKPSTSSNTHTVKKGETLYGIATEHKMTVENLKAYNNLKTNVINVGDKLNLKKPSSSTHTVKKDETLYGIARKYGTTVEAIKKANNLKSNTLKIGTKLKVK